MKLGITGKNYHLYIIKKTLVYPLLLQNKCCQCSSYLQTMNLSHTVHKNKFQVIVVYKSFFSPRYVPFYCVHMSEFAVSMSMFKLFAENEFSTHCARKQVSGKCGLLQKNVSDMGLFVGEELDSEEFSYPLILSLIYTLTHMLHQLLTIYPKDLTKNRILQQKSWFWTRQGMLRTDCYGTIIVSSLFFLVFVFLCPHDWICSTFEFCVKTKCFLSFSRTSGVKL